MKWIRSSPGVYDSADGVAHLTFIPAHWEVTLEPKTPGETQDVFDVSTLVEAKASYAPEGDN